MPTVIQFNRRPNLEGEEETPVGLPPAASLQPRIAASGVGVRSSIVLPDRPGPTANHTLGLPVRSLVGGSATPSR
jgi:hypothetical protein